MIKKYAFLAVLSMSLIVFLLSGCQNVLKQIPFLNPTTEPTPSTAMTPAPTLAYSMTQVPSQVTGSSEELSIWLPPQFDPNNGTPAGDLFKAQLEKFSADNPGVSVNVRIKSENGSGGMLDSLTTASTAAPSILPGLVILSRSDLERAAQNGLLFPLEPADFDIDFEDMFPFARDMGKTREAAYGVPFAGNALVLEYKPLQIGYPPMNWRDILQQQAILAFPAADPESLIPLLLYQQVGGVFNGDEEDVLLDEIPLQRSLQIIADGTTANVFPYWLTEYTTFDQSQQALIDSSAAYAIVWTSQYLSEKTDNLTITSLPTVENQIMTLADGWILAFPQTSSERYLAHLKLAECLIDPEFHQAWSEAAGILPVSKTVLSGWSDQGLSKILYPIAESARLIPTNNIIDTLGPLLNNASQGLIRKQISYIQASNAIIKELTE